MNKLFFISCILFQSFISIGQYKKIDLTFSLRSKNINDSVDLDLFVQYNNLTNQSIYVYKELINGNPYEKYCNIVLQLERLEKGEYKKAFFQSYGHTHDVENEDSVFHSNIEKILPSQKKILKLNLLEVFYQLLKGKYRVKAALMKISDDINKPATMSYYPPKYLYFKVLRDL